MDKRTAHSSTRQNIGSGTSVANLTGTAKFAGCGNRLLPLKNLALGPNIAQTYAPLRISPVFQGIHSRNRNRGSGTDDPTDGLVLSLISPPEKHGAPASCLLKGCGVEAVFWFPRLLRDWDANSAVVTSACLGMQASVVGWPGMRTIRRRVSVTPVWRVQGRPAFPSRPGPSGNRVGKLFLTGSQFQVSA